MSSITLPYHLVIPALISILILLFVFYKRNQFFQSKKWKSFWISTTVFFVVYLFIVGSAAYEDISLQWQLQQFDLDNDGFFSSEEQTPKYFTLMDKLTADTGRNFSFIIGFIFSGVVAVATLVLTEIILYFGKNKSQ